MNNQTLTVSVMAGFATAGSKKDKKKGKKGAAMTFEPEPEPEPEPIVVAPEPEKKEEDDMWGEQRHPGQDTAPYVMLTVA